MNIHSPSVSRCSSAMIVHEVPLLITKGYQAKQKSESVRHVLVLRGISQFAMKAFLQLKRPSGQRGNRALFKQFTPPSIRRPSRGPRFKLPLGCPSLISLGGRDGGRPANQE